MTWQRQKPRIVTLVRATGRDYPKIHGIFCKSSKVIPYVDFVKRWGHSTIFHLIRYGARTVGFTLITPRNEIGYFILPAYQRQHYGTQAVRNLMVLVQRPYYWAMIPHDKPHSVKFIKSMGFHHSGSVYAFERKPVSTKERMGIRALPR